MLELDEVAQLLSTKDPEDAKNLFRSLFFSKLQPYRGLGDVSTFSWLNDASYCGLVECLRTVGGLPYFVVGDSHAYHYVRNAELGPLWLAPVPIYYYGCPAYSLSDESLPTSAGSKILRWAHAIAESGSSGETPFFLKFGGMDAELLWFAHRFNHTMHQSLPTDFDTYARHSITQYGNFLHKFGNVIDRERLKVCSVFPASIEDSDFENRVTAIMGLDENQRSSLINFEKPTLLERTILRARYNDHMRDMCDRQKLTFVDDYSPFLDQNGNTDNRYRAPAGDHHLAHGTTEQGLVEIIQTFVIPGYVEGRSQTLELSVNKKTLPQLLTALPEKEIVASQTPPQPTVDITMTPISLIQSRLLTCEQENKELKSALNQARQDAQTMYVEHSSVTHQIALLTQRLESTEQHQVFANKQLEMSNRTVTGLQYALVRFAEINRQQQTQLTYLNQNRHSKGIFGKWVATMKQALLPSKVTGLDLSKLPNDFDSTTYLSLNPDVAVAGIDPQLHYLRHGRVEGRVYKSVR